MPGQEDLKTVDPASWEMALLAGFFFCCLAKRCATKLQIYGILNPFLGQLRGVYGQVGVHVATQRGVSLDRLKESSWSLRRRGLGNMFCAAATESAVWRLDDGNGGYFWVKLRATSNSLAAAAALAKSVTFKKVKQLVTFHWVALGRCRLNQCLFKYFL